jgi:hypothetical protein
MCFIIRELEIYLVLQVIPPVWPRLFDTALLFDDRLINYSSKYAERHRNAVVIVAVDADATLLISYRFAIYFEAIVQFLGLDTKFRCTPSGSQLNTNRVE